MNRKDRRAQSAKYRKTVKKAKGAETPIGAKMLLFGLIPEECTACSAAFDKTDREMVMSWNVVVREEEEKVNLYCPPCWQQALDVINGFYDRVEEE